MSEMTKQNIEDIDDMPLYPEGSIFYFVGKWNEKNNAPEMQGIFSTKEKAIIACRDRTYFYHPFVLDVNTKHESEKWSGVYPISE